MDDDRGDVLYDDASAMIFGAALLSVYCIPAMLVRAKRHFFPPTAAAAAKPAKTVAAPELHCTCSSCHTKFERIRMENRRWHNTWGSPSNIVFAVAWVALLLLLWTLSRSAHSGSAPFDPFDILGISADASDRDISKAYRAMSLRYHPDKNLGDPAAEDTFVKINKAYEALTDDVSRQNYKQYGNPDGFQGTKFGVGLPSWLVRQGYVVVVIYLILLVVVFPVVVGRWWWKRSQRMNDAVLARTFVMYCQAFVHMSRFREIVTAYASAYEFEDYFKKENMGKLSKLAENLKKTDRFDVKNARFFGPPENYQIQAALIVNAHLARVPIPVEFQPSLEAVLRHTEPLTQSLAEGVAQIVREDCKAVYAVRSYMRGYTPRLMTAIHVSQCLCQAMNDKDSPLLQIPHFSANEVRHCTTKSKNVKTVYDFAVLPDDRRREILRTFTDSQLLDVNEFCLRYPEVEIDADDPIVEDELDQSVHAMDHATVKVRLRMARGTGSARATCSWRLPQEKEEVWWVFLTDADRSLVLSCKRLKAADADEHGNYTASLQFYAPIAGKYNFTVHAMCDCYVGCDRYKNLKVSVLDKAAPDELPRYFDTSDESDYDPDEEYEDDEDDDDVDGDDDGDQNENSQEADLSN